MAWSDPLDLYCERLGPGLWAEPLNAVSNAAFFIAAIAALIHWRKAGGRDTPALLLILVAFAIAIGSTIFHTIATRAALLADIIPIAIFMAGYLVLVWRRYLKFGVGASLAVLAGFEIVSFGVPAIAPPDFLNRSVPYLPALLMLILVAALVQGRARTVHSPEAAASHWLWIAASLFSASFFLRSIDMTVCPVFPYGTHFIWHCLNAGMIYVLLRAASEWTAHSAARKPSPRPRRRRSPAR